MHLRAIRLVILSYGLLGLALPLATQAYSYSSTYVPYLYVTVDGGKVSNDVVIRAHRSAGDVQEDHIYACAADRCAFNQNNHTDESNWTYFIEKLNKAIPKEKINKAKAVESFYLEEAEVKHSQDITGAIQQLNFTASEKKVDYVMNVNTKKGKVVTDTVEQGDYKAGDDGLAMGKLNISANTIRIGVAVLVIVMIYGVFKLFPMGHH